MFNTRGGGGAAPGMRGGGEGVASPAGDGTAASGDGGAGSGPGAASAAVLDLIQPHSVSAEEVAGFYGCTMGQART